MSTNLYVTLGWIAIILVSLFTFIKGRLAYKLIKGSMLGKITQALVYSTLVNVSCIGIISTLYVLATKEAFLWVLTVFIIWFVVFIWTLIVIGRAGQEAKSIVGKK